MKLNEVLLLFDQRMGLLSAKRAEADREHKYTLAQAHDHAWNELNEVKQAIRVRCKEHETQTDLF